MSVSEAVKAGRLVKSVTRDEHGQPKITSFELADQEWLANTDAQMRLNAAGGREREVPTPPTPRPTPPEPEEPAGDGEVTLANASARGKLWDARHKELKFRREAQTVADVTGFKAEFGELLSQARTKLLGLPTRAKQEIPELTLPGLAKLEGLIREALEDLTRE